MVVTNNGKFPVKHLGVFIAPGDSVTFPDKPVKQSMPTGIDVVLTDSVIPNPPEVGGRRKRLKSNE
jgi:hypothetical protein